MKVMTIFGTRPEAIKMAPVVRELLKHKEIETKVCLTAQHREMLDQVVDLFDLPVDYDLDIMKSGQTLYDITARVLRGLEDVLKREKPDYVLVHGDTTTTFNVLRRRWLLSTSRLKWATWRRACGREIFFPPIRRRRTASSPAFFLM